MPGKSRLLFIDALKIIGIAIIVWDHILWVYVAGSYFDLPFQNMIGYDFSSPGVTLFLVASGAALAYSAHVLTIKDIKQFYLKRILRIYPAFLTSVILTLAITGITISYNLKTIIVVFSGFQAYLGDFDGPLGNWAFWFIGLIICLYLVYPFLDYSFNRHPHVTIIILLLISLSTRAFFMFTDNWGATKWFFLCRIFEFGLGAYLIKMNFYPHIETKWEPIKWMSDISFYVFLIHVPLLKYWKYNPLYFIFMTLAMALMVYSFEQQLRRVDLHSFLRALVPRIGTSGLG